MVHDFTKKKKTHKIYGLAEKKVDTLVLHLGGSLVIKQNEEARDFKFPFRSHLGPGDLNSLRHHVVWVSFDRSLVRFEHSTLTVEATLQLVIDHAVDVTVHLTSCPISSNLLLTMLFPLSSSPFLQDAGPYHTLTIGHM